MHRELQQKRDQASQIHKMAMEINSSILSEMQVPLSYLETLPKVCQLLNLILPAKDFLLIHVMLPHRVGGRV